MTPRSSHFFALARYAPARTIASFVGLQLGWLACVLGAAHGHPWVGPVFVVPMLALHWRAQPREVRRGEALVLALVAAFGFVIDTILLRSGVVCFGSASISPLWLIVLWPNTAASTAPGGALHRLSQHRFIAAALGAVAGPLAYDGGVRLGAISFEEQHRWRALAILACVWLVVLPAVFALRARLTTPRGP